jgi:hypothetical protein
LTPVLPSIQASDLLQAIIEEKWGVRGGQRAITLLSDSSIVDVEDHHLKTIRQHQAVLRSLPGAVHY